MFTAIARFSVRFRWPIIIFWIAAVPILSSTLPKIGDVSKNDNSAFLPKTARPKRLPIWKPVSKVKTPATRKY
jgi:uncharacterized membrane protein YdfJ with MMPL/SSD domain